jgi:hypothetical protein
MSIEVLRASFGLLLLVVGNAYGSIAGARSLVELEQSADLIVVGTASGGVQSGSTLSFSLQVGRVIKGDPTVAGTLIAVDWASPTREGSPDLGSPEVAGNGLWFLRRSSSGWGLLPAVRPVLFSETYIPEPPGPIAITYVYSPSAAVSDKVASEIGAALEAANGGGAELAALYYLLDELHSPVIQRLYKRMSASASPNQKILGLSGLIRGGSAAALTAAFEAASSLNAYPLEAGVLLNAIRNEFRSTDSTSVEVLGHIAASTGSSQPLRESAARALVAIHTKQALPYLAALLDDPDPNLRSEGIGGLGSFANGLPVQTPAGVPSLAYLQRPASAPYMTKATVANFALGPAPADATRLSFWKAWWLQNRASLGY